VASHAKQRGSRRIGPPGLEPKGDAIGFFDAHAKSDAQNDAHLAPTDPALAKIIAAWPTLDDRIKGAMIRLIG
jgi:hypothetical protein